MKKRILKTSFVIGLFILLTFVPSLSAKTASPDAEVSFWFKAKSTEPLEYVAEITNFYVNNEKTEGSFVCDIDVSYMLGMLPPPNTKLEVACVIIIQLSSATRISGDNTWNIEHTSYYHGDDYQNGITDSESWRITWEINDPPSYPITFSAWCQLTYHHYVWSDFYEDWVEDDWDIIPDSDEEKWSAGSSS